MTGLWFGVWDFGDEACDLYYGQPCYPARNLKETTYGGRFSSSPSLSSSEDIITTPLARARPIVFGGGDAVVVREVTELLVEVVD